MIGDIHADDMNAPTVYELGEELLGFFSSHVHGHDGCTLCVQAPHAGSTHAAAVSAN